MDLGLAGRVAVVTGASQGIGQTVAEHLAHEGARVAVTYRHDRARAEAVVAGIQERGGDAMMAFLDLSSDESIRQAARQVMDRWGRIDVLVNNAMQWAHRLIAQAPPFEHFAPDQWQPLLRANIEGVYAATGAVLPSMKERRWGRIINMSAVFAADGMRGAAWYTTVKTAIHGLTRSLAEELGPHNILVNAVMPGLTLTRRTLAVIPEPIRTHNAAATPIGRLLESEEIARVVAFLASAANTAITGQIVRASGGFITPHRPATPSPPVKDAAETTSADPAAAAATVAALRSPH